MLDSETINDKILPFKKKYVERYYTEGRFKRDLLGEDTRISLSRAANEVSIELEGVSDRLPSLTKFWNELREGKERIEKAITLIHEFKKLSMNLPYPIEHAHTVGDINKITIEALDHQAKLQKDLLSNCREFSKSVQVNVYMTLGMLRMMQIINVKLGNPLLSPGCTANDASSNPFATEKVVELINDVGLITRMEYHSILVNLSCELTEESNRLEKHRKKTKHLPLSEADGEIASIATSTMAKMLDLNPSKSDAHRADLTIADVIKGYLDYMWCVINLLHRATHVVKPGIQSLSFKPKIAELPPVQAEEVTHPTTVTELEEAVGWYAVSCVKAPGNHILSIHNFMNKEKRDEWLVDEQAPAKPDGFPDAVRRPVKVMFEY